MLRRYDVVLESPVSRSFRCQKAADSLDIDAAKKAIHRLSVTADLDAPYNLGVIVGASGSGKTTLAQAIFGADCFSTLLELDRPVIEEFPEELTYDQCAALLCGVGLTSVPCWIRPAYTLSNGQRARAEIALQMARATGDRTMVIDEWTSVVDRTVAKVMSHCIQKHARSVGRRLVLLSCHYDVIEWLNPDWIIDCNDASFADRRGLWRSHRRSERLDFELREVTRDTWRLFSRYHYLSDKLPGGFTYFYGLFHGADQVGFICFANYVPRRAREGGRLKLHANRIVIHPDYAGMGLGIRMTNAAAAILATQGHDIYCAFSSAPMAHAMAKDAHWRLINLRRDHKTMVGGNIDRLTAYRVDVKMYSYRYVGTKKGTLPRGNAPGAEQDSLGRLPIA